MRIAGIELPSPLEDAVRGCRPHFAAIAIFSFLMNLLYLAPAIYMLQVYDRVVATGGKTSLLFITLALAAALLTLTALDAVRSRLMVRASIRIDAMVTPILLRRMLSIGGRNSVQAMRDFDTTRQLLTSPVATALFDAPWAPVFILVAFMLHFWIGMLAIASVLLIMLVAWRNQLATRKTIDVANQALAAAQSAEQTAALHAQTIRALGMTGVMGARQLAQRALGLSSFADAQFAGSRFSALSRFLRLFVQSAALGLGALLAILGYISAGAIIAASILLGRALQPVEALVSGWSALSTARAALARLADALSGPLESDRIRTQLPAPRGFVEVDQIGLRGEQDRPILYGVSFKVSPGEMLGIIGPSGSGKTTLARVIVGGILPEVGSVRIDGAQLADWDPDQIGRHIGYLPQEPTLFEGTIKDNISRFASWLDQEPTNIDAGVVAAARLAGVHELILQLPKGYDSELGPAGAGLSAGQAQRIALARALFGDPALLVLDEPNAFLDADGEVALIQAIEAARKRKASVIVIAHRQAVLRPATHLLVMEAGRPKMLGPAKEVVARLAGPTKAENAA